MADLSRGKKAFDGLVEYPLPKKAGVRDYLFYFVPGGDGYGKGARYFFDRFYPNHVKKEPHSLEDLITILLAEVTQGGVQQIREIVVVAHGNSVGLLLPILNGVSDTNQGEYKYWTAFSLALLQKDLREGKFQAFRDKRKKVIAHLQNDSWVTIRACNFGNSSPGMYATYSFFGGKPNVYAPTVYQFFGSHPIMEGMRLETKLKVHEHLVKQHFLPRDVHTPERKDAIVKALIDPGQFSEPFQLGSMRVDDPAPDDQANYERLVDDLNAGKISESIKSKFVEQELTISPAARVSLVTKDSAWLIKDAITHEGTSFQIQYQIYEVVAIDDRSNRRIATLWAEAKLVQTYSAHEFFPIQLFFSSADNDKWRGKLFTLAAYSEEPDADPQNKTKFDSVLALLNGNKFSDASGGVDIRAEFKREQDIDLSPQATIKLASSSGSGAAKRIAWSVESGDKYLIRLEHPLSSSGIPAHTIAVYNNPDKLAGLKREYELMAKLGSDPDTPGTELAAYLDRLSPDDLASLIDYLRSPFKPGRSLYIFHAIEALRRKREFVKWLLEHEPDVTNAVLSNGGYSDLSLGEGEDKKTVAYEFDFDSIWNEVKASSPSTTVVQEDLFAEEDLGKKLKIPEDVIAKRGVLPELESDSPYTDIEELRALEKLGIEKFFSTDKSTFEPPEENKNTDCDDLRAALAKVKEMENQKPEEIKKVLEGEKTAKGTSYYDIIKAVGSQYSFIRKMAKLVEILKLPPIPVTIYDASKEITKQVIKKVPALSRIVLFEALYVVLDVLFVFEIPFKMWMNFLEEQVNTDRVWEAQGRVTAIRQWLRALDSLTFTRKDDFPDEVQIDISTPARDFPNPPYYLGRYYSELQAIHGFAPGVFVSSPDSLHKGYDEGSIAMDKVGGEILRAASDTMNDVLRETDLDSCKTKVLIDAGFLDIKNLKALVVRELANKLLDEVPRI